MIQPGAKSRGYHASGFPIYDLAMNESANSDPSMPADHAAVMTKFKEAGLDPAEFSDDDDADPYPAAEVPLRRCCTMLMQRCSDRAGHADQHGVQPEGRVRQHAGAAEHAPVRRRLPEPRRANCHDFVHSLPLQPRSTHTRPPADPRPRCKMTDCRPKCWGRLDNDSRISRVQTRAADATGRRADAQKAAGCQDGREQWRAAVHDVGGWRCGAALMGAAARPVPGS